MALNNNWTLDLKRNKISQVKYIFFYTFVVKFCVTDLGVFTNKVLKKIFFSKDLVKQTYLYNIPTKFLLRHHQHDTHEALGQKVCKDCPQVTTMFSYKFLVTDYATSFKVKIQFDHFRS